MFGSCPVLALDYETTGLQVATTDVPVGLGLSDGVQALYIPLCVPAEFPARISINGEIEAALYRWLDTKQLVGFNVVFDGSVYKRAAGHHAQWVMDCHAVYRTLRTEGFTGQDWHLKTAMVELLGWPADNTDKLYEWLAEHKLGKGEMWRAPLEILGSYCALDSGATFHLYELFQQTLKSHPYLADYLANETNHLINLVVDQHLGGLSIDTQLLDTYHDRLLSELKEIEEGFFTHELAAPLVQLYQDWQIVELLESEPPKLTAKGEVAVRWTKWEARLQATAVGRDFNPGSSSQLAWLFFEHLYPVEGTVAVVDGMRVTVTLTSTGRPSASKEILPLLGPLGKLLVKASKLRKLIGYVESIQALAVAGSLHVSMKVFGTVTGRLSGGSSE